MTVKEWHNDPELRMTLRKAMMLHPLREALEVLLNGNFPRWSNPPGVDPMAAAAMQHARDAGYYDFYRALVKLTEDPPDPRKQLPEPWGNIPE